MRYLLADQQLYVRLRMDGIEQLLSALKTSDLRLVISQNLLVVHQKKMRQLLELFFLERREEQREMQLL